jgi:hypothetical protein
MRERGRKAGLRGRSEEAKLVLRILELGDDGPNESLDEGAGGEDQEGLVGGRDKGEGLDSGPEGFGGEFGFCVDILGLSVVVLWEREEE